MTAIAIMLVFFVAMGAGSFAATASIVFKVAFLAVVAGLAYSAFKKHTDKSKIWFRRTT